MISLISLTPKGVVVEKDSILENEKGYITCSSVIQKHMCHLLLFERPLYVLSTIRG